MVEIKMTGLCENCGEADLVVVRIGEEWIIYCKYQKACERAEEKMMMEAKWLRGGDF